MTITSSLRKILDRKQWEMCAPAPAASTAGSFIVSSHAFDQLQMLVTSVSAHYLYDPREDSWLQLPASSIAGTFGAGSAGCYHPMGPTGTTSAGAAASLTSNFTSISDLGGYTIRITGGTGAGQERTIASNTIGANSIFTVTSNWTVNPDATSTWVLLTGRFWFFCGANVTQGLRYYDVATNTWSAALSTTGVTASFATDAKITGTPGSYESFATGTATSGTGTTLVNSAKTWATNQWANHQVRITAGTGAGQVRTITSNTGTTLTVPTWTTNPDATSVYSIEGNDDFLYLAGNNAVAMFRYSISGNTWTTLSPVAARAGAPGAGMSLMWLRAKNNSAWNQESAYISGRRIYSFRGAAGVSLDYYDIASNTWVSGVSYNRSGETFTTGTSWDSIGQGITVAHKDATSRFFRYDAVKNQLDPFNTLPYPQGAALVGDRLFSVDFVDGADTLTFLYHLRNTGTELFRCLIF